MTRIAVLDPTTLLGREVKEALEAHPTLGADLRLLTTDQEDFGTLTEVAGSAAVVGQADPETLGQVDVLFVCGELAPSRRVIDGLPTGATTLLLSPEATVAEGQPVVAGVNPRALERGAVLLSPHPAAVLLSHLLHALAPLTPTRAVATLVLPASLHGERGIDQLLEQTRSILNLAGPPEGGLFGGQLAFNVLPAAMAGEGVAGQVGTVLDGGPTVAVELLQGAVFHGLHASLWLEVDSPADATTVSDLLLDSPWIEAAAEAAALGPVAAATEGKILLGGVRAAGPGGFWVRAVMDNLTRGGALNAVEAAAGLEG